MQSGLSTATIVIAAMSVPQSPRTIATVPADTPLRPAAAADSTDLRTQYRTARLIAIVTGLLGAFLALATPFLPVVQTTAAVNWPQGGVLARRRGAAGVAGTARPEQSRSRARWSTSCPHRAGSCWPPRRRRARVRRSSAMFVRVSDATSTCSTATSSSRRRPATRWRQLQPDRRHLRHRPHIRAVRGPDHDDGPAGRRATLTGDLRPQVVGRVHRLCDGRGTAGAVVHDERRLPVLLVPHADQVRRDDRARLLCHADRAGRAGPPRRHRRPRAPPLPAVALAGPTGRRRRRRRGSAGAVALHRREHLRRRLPAHHGPGRPNTPATWPTTSAGSASPRRRSAGTTTSSRRWPRSRRPARGCDCPR